MRAFWTERLRRQLRITALVTAALAYGSIGLRHLVFPVPTANTERLLLPIRVDSQWGLIDEQGREVLPPSHDRIIHPGDQASDLSVSYASLIYWLRPSNQLVNRISREAASMNAVMTLGAPRGDRQQPLQLYTADGELILQWMDPRTFALTRSCASCDRRQTDTRILNLRTGRMLPDFGWPTTLAADLIVFRQIGTGTLGVASSAGQEWLPPDYAQLAIGTDYFLAGERNLYVTVSPLDIRGMAQESPWTIGDNQSLVDPGAYQYACLIRPDGSLLRSRRYDMVWLSADRIYALDGTILYRYDLAGETMLIDLAALLDREQPQARFYALAPGAFLIREIDGPRQWLSWDGSLWPLTTDWHPTETPAIWAGDPAGYGVVGENCAMWLRPGQPPLLVYPPTLEHPQTRSHEELRRVEPVGDHLRVLSQQVVAGDHGAIRPSRCRVYDAAGNQTAMSQDLYLDSGGPSLQADDLFQSAGFPAPAGSDRTRWGLMADDGSWRCPPTFIQPPTFVRTAGGDPLLFAEDRQGKALWDLDGKRLLTLPPDIEHVWRIGETHLAASDRGRQVRLLDWDGREVLDRSFRKILVIGDSTLLVEAEDEARYLRLPDLSVIWQSDDDYTSVVNNPLPRYLP